MDRKETSAQRKQREERAAAFEARFRQAEAKPQPTEVKKPEAPQRAAETESERKAREQRLAMISSKLGATVADSPMPDVQPISVPKGPTLTEAQKLERQKRADAISKSSLADSIAEQERKNKVVEDEFLREQEELKMQRTDSQKQRAERAVAMGGQKEEAFEESKAHPLTAFNSFIDSTMQKMYADREQDANLEFSFPAEGKTLKCNLSLFESRCSYFQGKKDFGDSEMDGSPLVITVTEFPSTVYEKLIEFVYTGAIQKCEMQPADICDLLNLSNEYCMNDLRQLLEQHAISDVEPATVMALLQIALDFNLNLLRLGIWRKVMERKEEYRKIGMFRKLYEVDPAFKEYRG